MLTISVSSQTLTGDRPFRIKDIAGPLAAIIVGFFMVVLDNTVVNVALPQLVKEFNSSLAVIQWTVTGYMLAQAAVIPLAGWLSDRFGAKRIFLISLALFTIGSVLCALSASAEQLILFRILQGLGGGMLPAVAMAFTYRLAPPNKVGAVMGMMGVPILLAPALGPVISGWLVDYASWKWIFLINLPIGIAGLLISMRSLPKINKQSVAALDTLGMILGPIAFAALSYGVSEGAAGWSSVKTIGGIVIGVIALILFAVTELRKQAPLLELRVFGSIDFTRAIIVQWISQAALFGTFFLIPIFLQQAKGYTAFDTGIAMLPQALTAAIFMPISGRLFDKIGARPLVMLGMSFVSGAALWLSQLTAGGGALQLIAPLALQGAGMGLCMMPLNTHIIQAAPPSLVSRVTALTNALQQVVSSLSIAALSTILTHHVKSETAASKQPIDAFVSAFGSTFLVVMSVAILGIAFSFMLGRKKRSVEGEGKPAEAGMMLG